MDIKCSKNKRHKRFSVTAHIAQEWQVDSHGDFLKIISDCTDIVHKPDPRDLFICTTCGATALVEK